MKKKKKKKKKKKITIGIINKIKLNWKLNNKWKKKESKCLINNSGKIRIMKWRNKIFSKKEKGINNNFRWKPLKNLINNLKNIITKPNLWINKRSWS